MFPESPLNCPKLHEWISSELNTSEDARHLNVGATGNRQTRHESPQPPPSINVSFPLPFFADASKNSLEMMQQMLPQFSQHQHAAQSQLFSALGGGSSQQEFSRIQYSQPTNAFSSMQNNSMLDSKASAMDAAVHMMGQNRPQMQYPFENTPYELLSNFADSFRNLSLRRKNLSDMISHYDAQKVGNAPQGLPAPDEEASRKTRKLNGEIKLKVEPGEGLSQRAKIKWTDEEDARLMAAVKNAGDPDWRRISEMFDDKTHVQCLQRWKKVLRPGLRKGHWTEEEDNILREMVGRPEGFRNWGEVAAAVEGRSAKQCRERWCSNLDPKINKSKFTEEEDRFILQLQEQIGNKWAAIANHMPGRTENAVKMRAKSLLKKKSKQWTVQEDLLILQHKIIGFSSPDVQEVMNSFIDTHGSLAEGNLASSRRQLPKRLISKASPWAKIAEMLANRSKNAVKMRWKFLKTVVFDEK